jgi:hypothetical protein
MPPKVNRKRALFVLTLAWEEASADSRQVTWVTCAERGRRLAWRKLERVDQQDHEIQPRWLLFVPE